MLSFFDRNSFPQNENCVKFKLSFESVENSY